MIKYQCAKCTYITDEKISPHICPSCKAKLSFVGFNCTSSTDKIEKIVWLMKDTDE